MSSFCAICTAYCDGTLRDGPFVVCPRCADEHPRHGGYAFNGGRPSLTGHETQSATIGEGNRRVGGKR